MIFVGDVSIAAGDRFRFEGFPDELRRQPLCLNLEGAVNDGTEDAAGACTTPRAGWSPSGIHPGAGVFGQQPHPRHAGRGGATQASLAALGLRSFGAGATPSEAALPVNVSSDSHDYTLLGCGWHVIGCRVAAEGPRA